ncbi:HAD domain-containing protein [Melaminivora sp.]
MVALSATFLEITVILFLDFDGVLHPDEAYMVKGRPVLRAEGALFMWAPLLVDALKNYPGVQIVLSTSWARELRFTRARSFLPPELQQRTIGATWHSCMAFNDYGDFRTRNRNTWWDRATRYQQIRRYADRAQLVNWIAIDDAPEGWADVDHDRLLQTDPQQGLGDPAAMARLQVLLESTARQA